MRLCKTWHVHTHTHTHSPSGCPLIQLKKYKKKIVNGIGKKNKTKPLLKIVNHSEKKNYWQNIEKSLISNNYQISCVKLN